MKRIISLLLVLSLLLSYGGAAFTVFAAEDGSTTPPALQLDTPVEVQLDSQESQVFSFTPTESDSYCFTASGFYSEELMMGESPTFEFSEVGGDDVNYTAYADSNNAHVMVTLEAGVTYLVTIYNEQAYAMSFTVSVSHTPDPESLTLSGSRNIYWDGTTDTYLDYFCSWTPYYVELHTTWTSSNEDVLAIVDSGDGYCSTKVTGIGETALTATASNGVSASITVTVAAPTVLPENETIQLSFSPEHCEARCTFTPSSSGSYTFRSTCYHVDEEEYYAPSISIYQDGNSISTFYTTTSDYQYVLATLEAGVEYTLELCDNSCMDVTYSITAEKSPAPEGITLTRTNFVCYEDTSIGTLYHNTFRFSPGGAADIVTVVSDNESVVKVTEVYATGYYFEITGCGTASVTATTSNGYSAVMTVSVRNATTIQTGYTEELSMTASGDSRRYYFTPEHSGYYTLKATTCQLNGWEYYAPAVYVGGTEMEISTDCVANSDAYYNYIYLEAGTTYSLNIYNESGHDITSTITLSESDVPTGISIELDGTDKSMTIYSRPGESNWFGIYYHFTPATAMAAVTATSSDENIVKISSTDYGYASCWALGTGTATVTLKVNDEVFDTCTINVLPVPELTGLHMNSASSLVGSQGDIWVWAEPENADLNCEFSIADTSVARILWTENCCCTIEYLAPGTTTLTATDTATGISTTCTITALQPKTITEGYSEVLTLERGGSAYYLFTPETTGNYQLISSNYSNENMGFSILSVAEDCWVSDHNCYIEDTYNVYAELEAGKTYRIQVYDYGNYDSNTSTISLRKATALSSISFYESEITMYYDADDPVLRHLGLELSPTYGYSDITFTTSDASVAAIEYWGYDYCVIRPEGIGQATIIATTSEGKTAVCTVTIQERPTATSLTCYCDHSTATVGMQFNFYVYSQPDGSAPRCDFTVSDPTLAEITDSYSDYCRLNALRPGTFTITATDTVSGLSISRDVTVVEPDAITPGSTRELTLDSNECVYFTYTPTETGRYCVSTPAFEGTTGWEAWYYSVDIFAENSYISITSTTQNDRNYLFAELEAGTEYFFCVTNYWDEEYSGSISFDKASPVTAITAKEDSVTRYYHGPNSYNSCSMEIWFTPATSYTTDITWTSSDPNVADVDYFGGSSCSCSINGIGTTEITGTTPDGLSVSFTVQVLSPEAIDLNEVQEITLDSNQDIAYTFTPTVSGRYVFTASGRTENLPGFWLTYNEESLNEIYAYNQDSRQVFADLTAGNTYYIIAENYYSTAKSCGISVTRAATEITGFELVQGEIKTMGLNDRYLPIYAVFEPYNACEEIIEWECSDPEILIPMAGSYTNIDYYIAGSGTVTITATTRSGMQASITVTVRDDDSAPCTHIWGSWTEATAPTILRDGEETRACTLCGDTETRVLEKLGNPFLDVEESQFYYDPVLWAADQDITKGHGNDTTFCPDLECTRGQIVTFLWRAAGEPEPETTVNPFEDVAADSYYCKAVLWAVENGITNGYGADNIFNPDGTCTRGQVATFLHRYSHEPEPSTARNPFQDISEDAYYYTAVLWAVEEGITNGYGRDDIFNPDGICTRGQIVTFLYRAMN
ncbi:MAG: S-layer homology domain-containing protein [Oscillospiraceae bacterium]|nr:S-layer homology domain-containing protein [Oscillospiraceae bacterium]